MPAKLTITINKIQIVPNPANAEIIGQKHIDLHSVFGKPMVQTTIFKNSYRTLKLDEVSKALLGDGIDSGKYKGLTGSDFQTLPVEEQKNYALVCMD